MKQVVFDTNIISFMLREQPLVIARMRLETQSGYHSMGCPMVWYEVQRGLVAKGASGQIRIFEKLFASFVWQDFIRDDWSLAARLWAQRRATGSPVEDADLLIAAFAINRQAIVVTDNEKDFVGLGVTIENWAR